MTFGPLGTGTMAFGVGKRLMKVGSVTVGSKATGAIGSGTTPTATLPAAVTGDEVAKAVREDLDAIAIAASGTAGNAVTACAHDNDDDDDDKVVAVVGNTIGIMDAEDDMRVAVRIHVAHFVASGIRPTATASASATGARR